MERDCLLSCRSRGILINDFKCLLDLTRVGSIMFGQAIAIESVSLSFMYLLGLFREHSKFMMVAVHLILK
jgi:hypothetical protein